jgi:signal transduction histidine kinase
MLRIREKLVLAYLLPATALIVAFAWLAYRTMRQTLESELGNRLVSLAQAATAQVDVTFLEELARALNDREDDVDIRRSNTYEYLRARLATLRRRTGVRGISIFDRQKRNLVEDSGKVPVGELDYARQADSVELDQVFTGSARASLLFTGKDGVVYKSGYAPVRQGERVVAALAVDGPAEFFTVLSDLQSSLIVAGGALALVVVAVSLFFASRLSRPLRSLVDAAQRIGRGELGRAISVQGRDEVGFLARTMEEMRQSIEARDRQMQMMLSGIAHEVRNPLGGIELYAGLLREELGDDPKKLARVQRIERELAYLKSVVNDFLDFARKLPLDRAPLELGPYLQDVLALVAADAEARGVETEVLVLPEASVVRVDADKLRRAILNLLRNALQAMPQGGRLTLETARNGDRVHLIVRDTGEGMPEEVQKEIFTPFFTTRERGTGLGLAFVKKIVEEHGGEVRVASAQGAGTAVTLALPGGEA